MLSYQDVLYHGCDNPSISLFGGDVPGKGESYPVPGTGGETVRRQTNFSPVPGAFTPNPLGTN